MQTISIILGYVMSPAFFAGAIVTLEISICGLAGGLAIGLLLALLQQSGIPGERPFRLFYLWFFRGTPVLFQVIFIFNVLPTFARRLVRVFLRRARTGAKRGGQYERDPAFRLAIHGKRSTACGTLARNG